MVTTDLTSEFETRFELIRAFLEREKLGAVFAYSTPMEHMWAQTGHVSYLSGWANRDRIVDSAVVVPAVGHPVLLYAGLDYMRVQIAEVSPLEDVRFVLAVDPNAVAPDPTKGPVANGFAQETLAILNENGLEGRGVGVVGVDNMSAPFYDHLSTAIGSRLRRIHDIVAELRYVKSPGEVEKMKQAARLSDLGFRTMVDTARPGMRGIEVVAEMERAVRREGADLAKYWMASGPPTDWADVRLDLKPHMRVLEEGDFMASCSYVCFQGYWCHGHRTGSLVRPSPELTEMCRITREAQDAGLAKMKSGATVREVVEAIAEHGARSGWEIQGGRVGHGIGLDYSESPSMFGTNETPLRSGTTAVVHTTFALPGSGSMFVPLGDVCHVTPDGPERLMSFGREPFVAGRR